MNDSPENVVKKYTMAIVTGNTNTFFMFSNHDFSVNVARGATLVNLHYWIPRCTNFFLVDSLSDISTEKRLEVTEQDVLSCF